MLKKIITAIIMGGALMLGFTTPIHAEETRQGFYINATHVNVRLSPSIEGKIIDQVNPGTKVTPVSAGAAYGNWTQVIYNGQFCFIYSKYISYQVENVSENKITEEHLGISESKIKSLGVHKVTTYCSCEQCCGKGGGKVTASGTIPTPGRTIGCNWLPLGTHVIIEGHEYIVEDRGASWFKGFDIFWGNDHQAALHSGFGRKIEVFIIEG